MHRIGNIKKWAIYLSIITTLMSCSNKKTVNLEFNELQRNEFLSEKFGKEIYLHGDLHYDDDREVAYYSGYIKLNEAEETGNYVFDFKNGNIINNYVDAQKSQRCIQDGSTDKNFIIGIGREFGVRMYTEYDNEATNFNQLAKFQIDTSNASIKMHLQRNDTVTSSIELKSNYVLIEKGVPSYESIEIAAMDNNLPSGAIFKVQLNEKISSLYIKN